MGSVFTVLGSYLSSYVYLGWVSLGLRNQAKGGGGGTRLTLCIIEWVGGGGGTCLERFRDPYRIQRKLATDFLNYKMTTLDHFVPFH